MKSNFYRKLVYMGVVLALYVVTLFVRTPIERVRARLQLSDTTLGDVDPTSSTMVLVLGGLRCVAANLLWTEAIEMQKEHDWTNLEVVVKSIVKLEPHFISVWTFQGWNLAYNVSVEWDQVSDKYYWIKQGIKFLRNGTEVNEHSPELRWDTGWTYFHKIGKADEAALLKEKYKSDDQPEIDAFGNERQPFNPDEILSRDRMLPAGVAALDNFQAAGGWFQKAVDKCDHLNIRPKRMGEVAFRSYPAHAQIGHAQSEEEKGHFESAQQGWGDAFILLGIFADHEYVYLDEKKTKLDYPASIYSDMYRAITLMTRVQSLHEYAGKDWDKTEARVLVEQTRLVWPNDKPDELKAMTSEERAKKKLDWAHGVWQMIVRDTPEMLRTFGIPTVDILPEGAREALAAAQKSLEGVKTLDPSKLVADGPDSELARKQFEEFYTPSNKLGRLCHEELYWCDRYASMINYRYWKERSAAESELNTVDARRHFYNGLRYFSDGDLEAAKQEFEDGLKLWEGVLDRFQRVRDDEITAEETQKIVKAYQLVCQQLDFELTEPPFKEYLSRYNRPPISQEEYNELMQSFQEMQRMTPEQREEREKELRKKFQDRMNIP
jgi:hypothetical protein